MSDHERRLKDFFRCYDLNGDGEITREELFKAMKRAVGYNDVGTNQIVDVRQFFPIIFLSSIWCGMYTIMFLSCNEDAKILLVYKEVALF